MKKIKYLFAILLLSSFVSCYQDKGSYDYNEINEIAISGLPTDEVSYFKYSDSLIVTPTIEGTLQQNEDNYTYQWVAMSYDRKSGTAGASSEISTERNLRYFITLPEDTYNVYLKVTDKKTNVTWRKFFPIKVTTVTKEGWIVLQNKAGDSRLDMVSLPSATQEIILRDFLKDSLPNSKGPRKIMTIADMYNSSDMARIAILTDEGTAHLETGSLKYDEINDYIYEFGATMDRIVGENICYWYMTGFNVFITDKDLYFRQGYVGKLYLNPVNNIDGKYFKPSPYVGTLLAPYSQATVYYDETNQQFVQILPSKTSFAVCQDPVTNAVFSFKTGRDMVYMGNTYHNGGRAYAILKGSDNKSWLYGIDIANASKFGQAKGYHYEITATNFEKAKHFAFHPQLTYLFYATDDKVYQFDMITKETKELKIGNEVGEKISFIKFNLFTVNATTAKYKELQDLLIVGSYNEAKPDDSNGVIRMYDIESNFTFDAKIYRTYKDFAKPIDITYKEK